MKMNKKKDSLITRYTKNKARKKKKSGVARPNLATDVKQGIQGTSLFRAVSSIFRRSPTGLIAGEIMKQAGKTNAIIKKMDAKRDGVSIKSKDATPKKKKLIGNTSTLKQSMDKHNVKQWR